MTIFLIAFTVFLLVVLCMAIGYVLQRKTISGSCGGITALGMDKVCDCPDPCDKRKARMAKEQKRRELIEQNRII